MDDQKSEDTKDINETNVDIAVRFLSNSNVKETDKEIQEDFLKKKGLSRAEINLAFQRTSEHVSELDADVLLFDEGWKFFDYVKGLALGAGIISVVNYAYKAYLLPYATRELRDDARLECLIESFQAVKDDIKQHTYELTGTLKQMQVLMEENQKSLMNINSDLKKDICEESPLAVAELKAELSIIKSMMLSRKEFPSMPYTNPKVNKIPAWQHIADELNAENILDYSAEESARKGENKSNEKHVAAIESKADQVVGQQIDLSTSCRLSEPFTPVESNVEQHPVERKAIAVTPTIITEESIVIEGDLEEAETTHLDISQCSTEGSVEGEHDVPVTTEVNGIIYEVVPNVEKLTPAIFPTEIAKEIFVEGTDVLKSEYDLTHVDSSELDKSATLGLDQKNVKDIDVDIKSSSLDDIAKTCDEEPEVTTCDEITVIEGLAVSAEVSNAANVIL